METADKDDKQGCMGAVERPPSTSGVCSRVCFRHLEFHITGAGVTFSIAPLLRRFVDTGLSLIKGHKVVIFSSRALQDCTVEAICQLYFRSETFSKGITRQDH